MLAVPHVAQVLLEPRDAPEPPLGRRVEREDHPVLGRDGGASEDAPVLHPQNRVQRVVETQVVDERGENERGSCVALLRIWCVLVQVVQFGRAHKLFPEMAFVAQQPVRTTLSW